MKTHIIFFSVLLLLFASCQEPQEPEFKRMVNFKIGEVQNNQMEVLADAVIYNPNAIKAEVVDLDIDLIVEEKVIGKINETKIVEVPASSEFSLPVRIMASTQVLKDNWLSSAISILTDGKTPVLFKGTVTIKVLKIPIKVPIEHVEELALKDLRSLLPR